MGYILELRKQVGHRPLIMTCAGVLLLNEKRELLLQKRADNGLWGYPGGSMELGDSFEDCARREVQEETGLICGNLEHFMNVSGEEVHYVYPNGDETSALTDSFQDNLLAPPVYTRPAEFNGWRVPEVLLSGNHALIDEWQEQQALERTKALRPDLLDE